MRPVKPLGVFCDRLVFLDKGRILAVGRPGEIKEKFGAASLEEAFLKIARKV